ncbi:family 5 glycoside hydrolase [Melampsora larici-populina 98AG31]|uniref:Family 5 glycoside hydrolase n=1 Tax=Melampsora larici-populina (strain 98AG31 / pathotype 3-4-7) TaxID=747676 RepID=F4RTD1_MELLP|nr:family 5 glycoside hydrolase [Melampsora larici-populina 98AG31]EGG04240.1 family 5 glycoside hydrolase [Melampsora larici-populina 98AG31]
MNTNLSIKHQHFIDQHNRISLLKGISISGNSKLPSNSAELNLHEPQEFFKNHRSVSFIGNPINLTDASFHLNQLKTLGFELIRLVICWESIEHFGPGEYDEEYLNYIGKLIEICEGLNLWVIIDCHQDVWSRLTGGSGAPGWTLDLVGFQLENLLETGAVTLHQFNHQNGTWPTGYQKLAAATMFTLFFAGQTFAPKRTVDRSLHSKWSKDRSGELISIETFLQESMIEAFGELADRLSEFKCVIGFEPMNEPHRGYINLYSPYRWNITTDLALYDCPNFIESLALGDGKPQSIDFYTPTWPMPAIRLNRKKLSPSVRAWKSGVECVWKEHGIWSWNQKSNQPIVLKPKYFNLDPLTGKTYDFYHQAFFPFIKKFSNHIQRKLPNVKIMVGPIPNEFYPEWKLEERPKNLVLAPHFYDLFSLVHKSFGNITLDVQAICLKRPIWEWIYFGQSGAKRNYTNQIKRIIKSAEKTIGNVPCLIGEIGMCMDLNKGEAFKTGDFTWQERQMDALICGLESNFVSFALWNYNPYNTDLHGDGWNGENFSFISSSAPKDSNGNHQPRLLKAILRPFARRIAGLPRFTRFDYETKSFEYRYQNHISVKPDTNQTEIFLPNDLYNEKSTKIEISDGTYLWKTDVQCLIWTHENEEENEVHWIKIQLKDQDPNDQTNQKGYHQLMYTVPSILIALIGIWSLVSKKNKLS